MSLTERISNNDPALVKAIIEQMPDAMILANTSGLIELWNPAAAELFGLTADQVQGQSLDVIIPERYRAAHWTAFHRSISEGHTKYRGQTMTTRALHKCRDPFYIDMAFAILRDSAGKTIGALATARDVTEKYLAQRELKERLSSLTQNSRKP